ncbi:cyclin-K-like isoform X1 [Stegodyphus dumicola]|uniref:cyclin-K-like isoform X1 n=1 Tax=Stegodyphus dumicola TaxID=202533 RepID=UPI0015A88472|nr:cyclin-K-like isoform X1 [Stegodyphus dumicola]XP_035219546.1 cyclin-K-like isoform X1 [Stegodyphus dumicola]XP_035219547.1 cyclin-K-like isoform X1 [Stegodyphus dumicola]
MTVLMPSWYYEKKDLKRSPSILDGLDIERESRYRREGARFIINVGTKMGLRYDTMATGVVYFHRFYMFHSFKTFPRYVTACCCLFLAGKVEETPKKCKDIIRIARTFLGDSQFLQFGDDPKEEVMTLERILLQTIKFDLQVDHPYGHLLKYAKCLKGDKGKLQHMVQMAWTFINDSLCTTLCLQWEPEVIAIALMYLAGKLSKFEVVDWVGRSSRHSHWWDMFVEGISIELLEDICHQVLDLYSTPVPQTPQDSPPATPPTKLTRKSSQPPSPIETSTSPAQTKPKAVDTSVGQPIPRLEPGELKRKVSQSEPKNEVPEKITRVEGKTIPTVSSSSPKPAANNQESETQASSPSTPVPVDVPNKTAKHTETPVQRISVTDAAFRSGITSATKQPYTQSASFLPPEPIPQKATQHIPQMPATSFSVTVPPPTATLTQPAAPYYTAVAPDTQHYPNIQQPPPQIYPPRPMQFQHPPPPVTPTAPPPLRQPPPQFGELPHQYPPNLPPTGIPPPFNSQFPPPRHQPPPNILNNPPPAPMPGITQHPPPNHPPPNRPQGMPPVQGMIRTGPPPPPGVGPRTPMGPRPPLGSRTPLGPPHNPLGPPRMMPDNPFGPRPGSEMYNPHHEHRGGRPTPEHMPHNQDFGPRGHYDNDNSGFQKRRMEPEFDTSYSEYDPNFRRHHQQNQFGQDFERPSPQPRRYTLEHQPHRKLERGPPPSMISNMSQQQGAPTGIPPVRITGSH